MQTARDVQSLLASVPLPDLDRAVAVVRAPGSGVGYWAGAPSAAVDGEGFWLAFRLRRPVGEGRGVSTVLARYGDVAPDGGVQIVGEVGRELFGAESLERPALVRRPDGGWRLYVSCATPDSKHWWIEALDADTVAGLPSGRRHPVFPGDAGTAVKDPVIVHDGTRWHAWVCCHPLDVPGAEDRMWTAYATSDDGLVWSDLVPVLRPDGAGWDARGTRLTAVIADAGRAAVGFYDGRADAAQNWFERTGIAVVTGPDGTLEPVGDGPVAQAPHGTRALRYLCVVPLPGGGFQLFFEASREDGAHDLFAQLVPA